MPILSNPKYEKFAQLVVGGMSASEAYTKVIGCSVSSGQKNAWRMKENEGVVARITELQAKSERKAEITRAEVLTFLKKFCDFVPSKKRIRPNDQLKAVEIIAKLCGWNEPECVQVGMEAELAAVIAKLRGRGKPCSDGAPAPSREG